MSMHLHHPSLSLNGNKRGKVKFRNAAEAQQEEKRRRRALDAEPLTYNLSAPPGRTTSNGIPSRVTSGGSTASVHKVYTGTKVLGIGTMHKSNAVPIFSNEEAHDIATMRRG